MSALPARQPARYEELFELPPNRVGEIVHGVLYSHPRPAPRHARSSSALGGKLYPRFDEGDGGPGGWWILDEPELHLGDNVLVPDLAGWRRERMPALPTTAWFELAPDWVCEILSPSTARLDRNEKMHLYAAEGVPHLWLIDPDLRLLEAYENQQGRWMRIAVHADQEQPRVPPFDAVALDLAGLWA
ncbi:MAG: Uma2 family endonuclease [Burkholderiaceae bacterium]|jgi:Uma2 family endonuclease|nr:Uma2 family endonuclease [Burkholderiaceae bacterium]